VLKFNQGDLIMNRRSFLGGLVALASSSVFAYEDVAEKARLLAHSKMRYASDSQIHGVVHKAETVAQAYARGFGDCEEFALAYRHELIQMGVSADRIGVYWCKVHESEAHCVAVLDKNIVLCCLAGVRTVERRPDLSRFRKYEGETEQELVASIQIGRGNPAHGIL
jgi:hypothetical protein